MFQRGKAHSEALQALKPEALAFGSFFEPNPDQTALRTPSPLLAVSHRYFMKLGKRKSTMPKSTRYQSLIPGNKR
jgi:hypothetical protein